MVFPNRELDLTKPDDRNEYEKWLKNTLTTVHKNFSLETCLKAIDFISSELGREWMVIVPWEIEGGITSLKTSRSSRIGLSHLYEILPMAVYLLNIKATPGIARLLHTLKQANLQRINTLTEVVLGGRYARAGFVIELEPSNEKGGKTDLAVHYTDIIHFEAKTDNFASGNNWKKKQEHLNYIGTALSDCIKDLPSDYQIVIKLPKEYRVPTVPALRSALLQAIAARNYEKSIFIQGAEVCISGRRFDPKEHRRVTYAGFLQLEQGKPKSLAEAQIIIIVSLSDIDKKFSDLIREAKGQLPSSSRGIIVIRTDQPDAMRDLAVKRLQLEEYTKVVAIIAMGRHGNGLIMRNVRHPDISEEFLKVALTI